METVSAGANDAKLAEDIRTRAAALVAALEAAGDAGLEVSISFKSYGGTTLGDRVLRTWDWKCALTVDRRIRF